MSRDSLLQGCVGRERRSNTCQGGRGKTLCISTLLVYPILQRYGRLDNITHKSHGLVFMAGALDYQ